VATAFSLARDGANHLWLASYPRSGNTLLRLILHRAFGLQTTSIYDGEMGEWDRVKGLVDLVGHYENAAVPARPSWMSQHPWEAFRLIKTHQPPKDSGPAIYVARDGRAAIVSYYHYIRNVQGLPANLTDVILGQHYPGSWSNHLRSWKPRDRPNTLLLRYEDLASSADRVCEEIAAFLQRPQIDDFDLSFEDLHRLHPQFFRSGGNAKNIVEIKAHIELFDSLHAETMREFGYY
jgi:hypothetical protein